MSDTKRHPYKSRLWEDDVQAEQMSEQRGEDDMPADDPLDESSWGQIFTGAETTDELNAYLDPPRWPPSGFTPGPGMRPPWQLAHADPERYRAYTEAADQVDAAEYEARMMRPKFDWDDPKFAPHPDDGFRADDVIDLAPIWCDTVYTRRFWISNIDVHIEIAYAENDMGRDIPYAWRVAPEPESLNEWRACDGGSSLMDAMIRGTQDLYGSGAYQMIVRAGGKPHPKPYSPAVAPTMDQFPSGGPRDAAE